MERDYRNPAKNAWREWGIDLALEWLGERALTETFVYMLGPKANDRDLLTLRGVPDSHCVGVDRKLRYVQRVRDDGGIGIHADIFDVLACRQRFAPVCCVLLDLMSGFEPKLIDNLLSLLALPALKNAVIVINLLRGRDKHSNEIRRRQRMYDPSIGRHRGRALLRAMADEVVRDSSGVVTAVEIEHFFNAEFNSYYSDSRQMFDSVALRPLVPPEFYQAIGDQVRSLVPCPQRLRIPSSVSELGCRLAALAPRRTRDRMAAVLAHQTMREPGGYRDKRVS